MYYITDGLREYPPNLPLLATPCHDVCHQTSPTTAHNKKTEIYKHHHQHLSMISSPSYRGVGQCGHSCAGASRERRVAKLAFLVYTRCEFSPKLLRTVRAIFDGDGSFGYNGYDDSNGDGNGKGDCFGKGTFHRMFILFIVLKT